jgi:hypothetical protein
MGLRHWQDISGVADWTRAEEHKVLRPHPPKVFVIVACSSSAGIPVADRNVSCPPSPSKRRAANPNIQRLHKPTCSSGCGAGTAIAGEVFTSLSSITARAETIGGHGWSG